MESNRRMDHDRDEPARKAPDVDGALQTGSADLAHRAADATVSSMLARDAIRVADAFYAAFRNRDTATMRTFYAVGAQFHDPLFGELRGADQVMLMWTSIMPKADPFRIMPGPATVPTLRADGAWEVRVHWDAHYGLGKARIVNHSNTTLTIKDGRIIAQRDVWDLAAWTAQALPAHLGGHLVTDLLVHAAAHSYIVVVDMIRHLHGEG